MTKKPKKEPVVPREVLRAFIKENNLHTAKDVQNALKYLVEHKINEVVIKPG